MRNTSRKAIGLPLLMVGWTTLVILMALSASVAKAATVFTSGKLLLEFWQGKVKGDVEGGTAGAPSSIQLLSIFQWPEDGSNEAGANYTIRVTGFFIPPTTGKYIIFVDADDTADLWLSTDDTAANKKMVAQQPGWSNQLTWTTDNGGGTDLAQRRSDTWLPAGVTTPPFKDGISLVAGTKYYIEGVMNEFGGGDNFAATFKLVGEADPADGDFSKMTGNLIGVNLPAEVTFVTQPASRRVAVGDASVTFSVFTYAQDAKIQWYKNGTAIPGATSPTYQVPAVVAGDNGATFYAVGTNAVSSTQSSNAVITVGKLVLVPGAKDELFDAATREDIENGSLDGTTPLYLNAMATFETPTNQTKDGADFPFSQRLSAIFLPPVTGDYIFFIAADDDSDLFISTDATPAKKYQIAAEPGWSAVRNWTIINAGSPLSQKRSDTWVPDPTNPPGAPPFASGIRLIAGNKYYIEGVNHEGGGGDNFSATYKLVGEPDPKNGDATRLGGFVLDNYVNALDGGLITITSQPQNTNGFQSQTATFTVGATSSYIGDATSASPGLSYQWQGAPSGSSTFTNIAGASGTSYTTPVLTLADNGAQFRVALLAGDTNATSSVATLTVVVDNTPPTIKSASAGGGAVAILFSELLDAASAGNKANYAVDKGVTVSSATLLPGVAQDAVKLAISGATAGTTYTVTVNGVKDRAGNAIAANSTVTFTPSSAKAFFDFDSGQLPLTTEVQGSATLEATGGINGTGGLQLTPPAGGQQGGFFIPDLDAGKPVFGIQVNFKLLITDPSGNPADGVSFSWGSDVSSQSAGEEGTGSGLIVEFDTFDNGGTDNYGIDVKWNGEEIGITELPLDTANSGFILVNKEWTDVSIGVYGNGDVYVTHHGTNYYDKLALPGFAPIAGGNFLFGGRTGGELARQVIDNLSINTFLEVTQAPTNAPPTTGIKLTATKAANNLTVSWTPTGGKLQSTTALAGAATVWTDVGTANPATVPISATGNLFLRVSSP